MALHASLPSFRVLYNEYPFSPTTLESSTFPDLWVSCCSVSNECLMDRLIETMTNSKSSEEGLRAFEEFESSCGIRVKLGAGVEVRLPLGFCFRPTEDQLVIHYLVPKAMSGQLPNYYIEEISNPLAKSPLQLTNGGPDEDRKYFFSQLSTSLLEKYSTSSGHWNHVSNKNLLAVDGDQVVEAYRTKYQFWEGGCQRSAWMMCIYSLCKFKFISKAEENTDGETWVVIRMFHLQEETTQCYNYITEDDEEEVECDSHDDLEQVSSNIVEDATTQLQQTYLHSHTDAGDATPTTSCNSSEVSTNCCSSRRR